MAHEGESEFQRRARESMENGGIDFGAIDFGDTSTTPLGGLARAYDEVYKEFLAQDFTSSQALYCTAAVFNGNPGIAPS